MTALLEARSGVEDVGALANSPRSEPALAREMERDARGPRRVRQRPDVLDTGACLQQRRHPASESPSPSATMSCSATSSSRTRPATLAAADPRPLAPGPVRDCPAGVG